MMNAGAVGAYLFETRPSLVSVRAPPESALTLDGVSRAVARSLTERQQLTKYRL